MSLEDFQSEATISRSRRGTTTRSLGAKQITPTAYVEKPSTLPGIVQKGV